MDGCVFLNGGEVILYYVKVIFMMLGCVDGGMMILLKINDIELEIYFEEGRFLLINL